MIRHLIIAIHQSFNACYYFSTHFGPSLNERTIITNGLDRSFKNKLISRSHISIKSDIIDP